MLKKIVIGADHLGKNLKDKIKEHLESIGIEVMDVGVTDESQVDYPDVGKTLAKKVLESEFERGILVCGTGAGMAIVANKLPKRPFLPVPEVTCKSPIPDSPNTVS